MCASLAVRQEGHLGLWADLPQLAMSTVDKPVKRKERSDDGRDERKESVKRARVALVKVDNAGAIIKRVRVGLLQ